jgi:hypothetical protein
MRTRLDDVLRAFVVVVVLVGALSSGEPLAWATLAAVIDRLLR